MEISKIRTNRKRTEGVEKSMDGEWVATPPKIDDGGVHNHLKIPDFNFGRTEQIRPFIFVRCL